MRVIIHIIAPIISMHGMMKSAPAPTPSAIRTTAMTADATQPHIMFIECFVLFSLFIALSLSKRFVLLATQARYQLGV